MERKAWAYGSETVPYVVSVLARKLTLDDDDVNEALFGLCIEAANLGYRLALPTDAIAGLPRSYAEDVVRYSLSLMCNLTTSEAVLGCWAGRA